MQSTYTDGRIDVNNDNNNTTLTITMITITSAIIVMISTLKGAVRDCCRPTAPRTGSNTSALAQLDRACTDHNWAQHVSLGSAGQGVYRSQLGPTRQPWLSWTGRSRVQIRCSSATWHVQHVTRYMLRRDSSAVKFDRAEIAFMLSLLLLAETINL